MISSAKTLVVSFIGMKSQELDVKSNLHISLKPDTETLDEVVVVAYGAAKKNSLTGSVATVKSDALEKVPTASFEKALQGLSAGVQVESQSGQPGSVSQVLGLCPHPASLCMLLMAFLFHQRIYQKSQMKIVMELL